MLLVMFACLVPAYLFYRFMGPVVSTIKYKSRMISAQFGGSAAIYMVLVWYLSRFLPTATTCSEVWIVKGSATVEDKKESLNNNDFAVLPSSVNLAGDNFAVGVIISPDPLRTPTLQVSHEGYQSANILLTEDKEVSGANNYTLHFDRDNKTITINSFTLKKK